LAGVLIDRIAALAALAIVACNHPALGALPPLGRSRIRCAAPFVALTLLLLLAVTRKLSIRARVGCEKAHSLRAPAALADTAAFYFWDVCGLNVTAICA